MRRGSVSARRGSRLARSTSSYRPSPSTSIYDPRLGDVLVKDEERNTPDRTYTETSSAHSNGNRYMPYNIPITRSRLAQQQHSRHTTPGSHHSTRELSTLHYGEPSHLNSYRDPITTAVTSTVDDPVTPDGSDDENELPGFYDRATPQLKGVQWPGMSIFDSATAIGRRRRNQKKSASVLEQLEANSLEVEPTEMVFTPHGSWKKSREISGLPSSSSPIVSPVQHHVKVYRPPLGLVESRHTWANQVGVTRYNSYTDRRLEEALTYGYNDTRKKKRTLGVYRDDQEVLTGTFSQPVQMSVLTRRSTRTRPTLVNGNDSEYDNDEEVYEPRAKFRKRKATTEQSISRNQVRRQLVNDNVEFDIQGRRSHTGHHAQGALPSSYVEAAALHNDRRQDVEPFSYQAPTFDFTATYSNQLLPQQTQSGQQERQSQVNVSRHNHSLSIENLLNLNSGMGNTPMTSVPGSFGNNTAQPHDLAQLFSFNSVNSNNLQNTYLPMPNPNHVTVPDWTFWNTVGSNSIQQNDLFNLGYNNQFLPHDLNGIHENGDDRSTPSVGEIPASSTFHNHASQHQSGSFNHQITSGRTESLVDNIATHAHTDQRLAIVRDNNEFDEDRTVTATPSRDGH